MPTANANRMCTAMRRPLSRSVRAPATYDGAPSISAGEHTAPVIPTVPAPPRPSAVAAQPGQRADLTEHQAMIMRDGIDA